MKYQYRRQPPDKPKWGPWVDADPVYEFRSALEIHFLNGWSKVTLKSRGYKVQWRIKP